MKNIFKDKDGNIVIAQKPNIPLVLWLALSLLSYAAAEQYKNGLSLVATAFLFCWAFLELTRGVNTFRKLLGLLVLTVIIIGYFGR